MECASTDLVITTAEYGDEHAPSNKNRLKRMAAKIRFSGCYHDRVKPVVALVAFITVVVIAAIVCSETRAQPTAGYKWSGYLVGEEHCAQGDVNYVLEARIETYVLRGSTGARSNWTQDVSMKTRTFVGVSGPFCDDNDGTGGPLGPCLQVNPGQTLSILVKIRLDDGMSIFKQRGVSKEDYWDVATAIGLDGMVVGPGATGASANFGVRPPRAVDMAVPNSQSMPGWDSTFDDINLHLHGLRVTPHLFFPQGTTDPLAPWVSITPASENPTTSSFCYVFDVPSDHPMGTFWYHTHRHGAGKMQAHQGMLGTLHVGSLGVMGSLEEDLKANGIRAQKESNISGIPTFSRNYYADVPTPIKIRDGDDLVPVAIRTK